MYLAPDLCIGYQYLSLGCIQISPLVVSHTMHSSFKDDSTLLGRTSFLQLSYFCIPLILQEYLKHLSLIWKLSLSGPCKVRATNSFCVPVLSYGFGIISWTKKEVEQFDVRTRKTLTSTFNHHPRSAIEHLYLPHHGLSNIKHLFYRKLVAISHHLTISTDPLVKLCFELDRSLPPCVGVISRGEAYYSALSLPVDLRSGFPAMIIVVVLGCNDCSSDIWLWW